MRKIILAYCFVFTFIFTNAQNINVNTSQYTVPQLVEDVLFGLQSTTGTGIISNITWSTGSNFGSTNGIGYFTNTNTYLPLESGLLLCSGSAASSGGPNNSTLSNGNWPGDAQLFNYIEALNIDPGLNSFNDATIIEFDFIPLINSMSFDFIFASEEYGTYQCTFSDAFAFFVNDVTAGTPVQNIALVPNTNIPISVVTIRNSNFNAACPSANSQYFGNYFLLPAGVNPNLSPTNFNGQTVLMTASNNVTPNHTYHMKLVVADRNDNALDSAVFIERGSFFMGQELRGAYGSAYENFKDFTIQNGGAICTGETRRITLGTVPITGATYEWFKDNVLITDANSYFYDVNEPGEYRVRMKFANDAQFSDTSIVESFPPLNINEPEDLYNSSLVFNLNNNNSIILNGQDPLDFEINYFTTLLDAQNFINNIGNPTTYAGFDGEQIFVRIDDVISSLCTEIKSFGLYQTLSNDLFAGDSMVYYPNPIQNEWHLTSTKNINAVSISNLLGQELFSQSYDQNDIRIDFSTLSSGTYFVNVISENNSKIIKVFKN